MCVCVCLCECACACVCVTIINNRIVNNMRENGEGHGRSRNYANSQKMRTTTSKRNVLNYVLDEVTLEEGREATTVNIPYQTSKVKFVYDAEKKIYERYVGNKLQKDWITGEALTTKNIIVTFANNYTTDEEGRNGRQALENIGKDRKSVV